MAKLSEKHPREAEIAKNLLADFRYKGPPTEFGICISTERADELEMKIAEALVDALELGLRNG